MVLFYAFVLLVYGCLLYTSPVSKNNIYLSKVLTAIITLLTSFIAIIICLAICCLNKDTWIILKQSLEQSAIYFDSSVFSLIFVMIITIFIEFLFMMISGILGIIISSTIIGLTIYKTFKIIEKNNIKNYKEFLDFFIKNEKIKELINSIINIFILVSFYVMIAGFGAYLEQEINLNNFIGSSILAISVSYTHLDVYKRQDRTCDLMVPNHARYQLRYTSKLNKIAQRSYIITHFKNICKNFYKKNQKYPKKLL